MPAGGTKRKKHHDKDKYYRLAKEQGLRSRAAFKLTQINRKYSLLTPQTKAVLDLCAAPGGWTQIASRTLPQTKSLIVAVDILPIRSLGSAARNVVTLVGDITTSQCQSEIRKELQTLKLDVVLCDGAPDVGASYDKDAFNQNEIALAALKCATQHLKPGGSFLTKIYRSRDYASYLWVVKQFFGSVEAVKPAASRMQSAEMFLVCKDYLAPEKIDGKMLDPRAVFGEIEEEEGGSKNVNIFHKKFNEQKKSRQGYDLTNLDATMRQLKSVREFIEGSDPISMLSQCHGLRFSCEVCERVKSKEENDEDGSSSLPSCLCQKYLNHSATDEEVKLCIPDLKVLNKGDFKHILSWREKLRESITNASPDDNDVDMEDTTNEKSETQGYDSDEEEKRIQQEISELKEARLRKKKKEKKKEREALAKKRRRIALGMEDSAIDIPEEEKVFTLAQITSKGDLEAVREVNLEDMEDDDNDDDDEINLGDGGPAGGDDDSVYFESDRDEETGYDYRLDRELDEAYETYLSKTKNAEAKKGTKMAKRTKKQMKERAKMKAEEDDQLENVLQGSSEADALAYAKLLTGKGGENSSDDDDDDADDDEDDGFHAEPLTPAEHASRKRRDNPLIYEVPDNEPTSAKTARWFENPLFKDISSLTVDAVRRDDAADDSSSDESSSDDDDNLNAEAVLALMPKTEKQKRHEKRIKDRARREAREKRRARKAGETPDMEIVAAEDAETETINDTAGMTPAQKKKLLEARDLIKKGLGTQQNDDALNSSTFEIVPPLPAIDTRKYDSDNESYDSDDRARTLALGTMILRPSRAKAFADASYNRYAWNDPEELPEWFQDDESRNYRPQLPIPKGLLEKMKERQMELAAKPIKKVAEARARKNKRAKLKLAAAKKKAESVVNSTDMTEAQKLKAISKALRGQESKKPGKTYVVSKKGGKTRGGKGIALVDKRMKNDKRAMDRADKKRKKGKQGGMTGSKKRRHHS